MPNSTTTNNKTVMSDRVMVQPNLRLIRQPHDCIRPVEPCQLDQLAAQMSGYEQQQQHQQQTVSQFAEIDCECLLENMTLNATDLANLDMYVVCSIQYTSIDGWVDSPSSYLSLKCLDSRRRIKNSLVLKSVPSRFGLSDSTHCVFEIDQTTMKARVSRLFLLKRTDFEVCEMNQEAILRDPSTLIHFESSSPSKSNDNEKVAYLCF